jgi:two-component system, cell cycle response regulator DivK
MRLGRSGLPRSASISRYKAEAVPRRRWDGAESVAKAASQRPDLVLMDIQLPVLDGYDATRQIKALPGLAAIPIIAVSSFAMKGDEEKARASGCDDYVTKPYSPVDLLRLVRRYLPPR